MPDCAAPRCGKPLPDTAYVCAGCERDLAAQLHEAAALWPELQVTIARQARMADPGPRARGRAPAAPIRPGGDPGDDHQLGCPVGLPFNYRASLIREDVQSQVTTWARLIVEERGGSPPADTPGLMRWLTGQLGWCRYQRWAGEMWDWLAEQLRLVEPAVDRPTMRTRVEVGPCPDVACVGLVTALVPARRDQAAVLRCGGCGDEWATHQWARFGRRITARMQQERMVT